jgi:hypothetical protein
MLCGNTVSITNKLYLAARLSLASSPESLEFALPTTYVLLDLSSIVNRTRVSSSGFHMPDF